MTAFLALTSSGVSAGIAVDRVDPPHWWTGMNDNTLQLQVYGKDIRNARFDVDYSGVTVDSVARLDGSPNWMYVYLNVSDVAKPGEMKLKFSEGKKTRTVCQVTEQGRKAFEEYVDALKEYLNL